ncbi:uncharacterized protein METZ01_LOCUS225850 [marine metagenome]|uniref:Uncharacterized protein n=1 Tax=marine metagenome TaxID=408172 RepID=A0A382GCL7_9ZZZZ
MHVDHIGTEFPYFPSQCPRGEGIPRCRQATCHQAIRTIRPNPVTTPYELPDIVPALPQQRALSLEHSVLPGWCTRPIVVVDE